jgi:hypothetical protein
LANASILRATTSYFSTIAQLERATFIAIVWSFFYFDAPDPDKPWYVIQSQQGDPVAIISCDATTRRRDDATTRRRDDATTHVATVVWRAAFEPYGSVVWASNATADPFPRLAMGHKGLFVERLDAPPVVWFDSDDERLAPEADLLVLMRNRQYLPRLGRFLQPDPNATGVAVQPSLAYGGSALPTPDPYVDLHSWAADGTNPLAYALSDPVNGADPTGLFFAGFTGLLMSGVDQWMNTTDVFDQAYQGVSIGLGLWDRIDRHYAMQAVDAEWAGNWDWSDDWFQNVQIDDGLQGVVDNVGPAVASARIPIGTRVHGGLEHNTMMRHEIMTLLDNRVGYGYKSRAEMLRNIRFNQAASDLSGKTLSNLRPDIAFLNKKTGKIDIIEVEWSQSGGTAREAQLRGVYGKQMGTYTPKGPKYRTSKFVRYRTKLIPPKTIFRPRR